MSTPSQLTIAVDPGANGGVAVRYSGQPATAWAMPESDADLLSELEVLRRYAETEGVPRVAFMERVGGYVAGNRAPGSAMFNFGDGYGFLRGALMAHGWRLVLVRPQEWQKRLSIGNRASAGGPRAWKARLKDEAQRRFPGLRVTNATADALLILDVCAGKEEL